MSKPRFLPFWPALAVVAVSLGAAAFTGILYFRSQSVQASRVAKLEAENRQARLRSGALEREVATLRGAAPPPAPAAERPARTEPEVEGKLEESRFVYQLRDKLAAANASIASLQSRVEELQAEVANAKQESARLAASEADLREKMNGSARVLEAVQNELKTKGERLTQAEISNRLLKDENHSLSDKVGRITSVLRDFDDINRRRETYLSNMLRRYRDVTEQFRTVSDRLEKGDSAGSPGPEMSSIGNTISLAEDDLRQLTALNAQAVRLRQRLNGK